MKRPIKFRQKLPFGYTGYAIAREDVAQLVGYDKEIYEGDIVSGSYEVEAKLIPNVVLTNFTLKEKTK